jgi:ribose 1,5-bisphosphokinase
MSGDDRGCFIAVVGPSGAGKDSLIAYARSRLSSDGRFVFPQRVITRPPDGTEPHEGVDDLTFRRLASAGGFALQWQAHGLSYGIPASAAAEVAKGRIAIVNLSRSVVPVLRQRFPGSAVIGVQAPPEVLAARLSQRGREEPDAQRARLARALSDSLSAAADAVIHNDGPLEAAGERFVALLSAKAGAPQILEGA